VKRETLTGPVAVGGIGGSGTRVVARILQILGGYIGGDLNATLDNLLFEKLMARPTLKAKSRAGDRGARAALAKFEQRMNTAFDSACGYSFWGFKEPCAAMWVEEMASVFPDLRYIHITRNGRDMCLSNTMRWVESVWGSQYGVNGQQTPSSLFHFWENVNEEAIAAGELIGDRFLHISFEALCEYPREHVDMITSLIGIDVPERDLVKAANVVRVPTTIGRGTHLEIADKCA
jgi:hypothetical protein